MMKQVAEANGTTSGWIQALSAIVLPPFPSREVTGSMPEQVNHNVLGRIPTQRWVIAGVAFIVFFCVMMILLCREVLEEYRKLVIKEQADALSARSTFHGVVKCDRRLTAPVSEGQRIG